MQPSEEMVEAAARADAEYDNKDWHTMGRIHRDRYTDRARRSLAAALATIKAEPVAWIDQNDLDAISFYWPMRVYPTDEMPGNAVPLYAAPLPEVSPSLIQEGGEDG